MKIDWKARLTNKSFWVYIVGGVVTLTQLFGIKVFPDNWSDILNTILGILVFTGIIVDNSSNGLSDKQ